MMLLDLADLRGTRLRKEPEIAIFFHVFRVLRCHRTTAQRPIRLDSGHHSDFDALDLLVKQLGIALFMLCRGAHHVLSNLHFKMIHCMSRIVIAVLFVYEKKKASGYNDQTDWALLVFALAPTGGNVGLAGWSRNPGRG